jgi:hypothetical protein
LEFLAWKRHYLWRFNLNDNLQPLELEAEAMKPLVLILLLCAPAWAGGETIHRFHIAAKPRQGVKVLVDVRVQFGPEDQLDLPIAPFNVQKLAEDIYNAVNFQCSHINMNIRTDKVEDKP